MFSGALILESVRVGARLNDLNPVVREIYRFRREDATADQPETWSVLDFEVSDDAPQVAEAFASVLSQPRAGLRLPSRRSGYGVDTSGAGHLPLCTGPVHDEGAALHAEVPGVRACPDCNEAASERYRRQRDENTVIPDPAVWLDHRLRIVDETHLRMGGQCLAYPVLDLDGDGASNCQYLWIKIF